MVHKSLLKDISTSYLSSGDPFENASINMIYLDRFMSTVPKVTMGDIFRAIGLEKIEDIRNYTPERFKSLLALNKFRIQEEAKMMNDSIYSTYPGRTSSTLGVSRTSNYSPTTYDIYEHTDTTIG